MDPTFNDFATDANRKAFFAKLAASGGNSTHSQVAMHATAKASLGHGSSKSAHKAAAAAHKEAAAHHEEHGRDELAQAHREAAVHHTKAARKATHNEYTVDMLIANGYLGSHQRGDALLALNTQGTLGSGSDTIQGGGEEDSEDQEDSGYKSQRAKGLQTKVKVGDAAYSEADDMYGSPSRLFDSPGDAKTQPKGGRPTGNVTDINAWLQSTNAPPDVVSMVQNAAALDLHQRRLLVNQLREVISADPGRAQLIENRLRQCRTTGELKELLALVGPAPTANQYPVTSTFDVTNNHQANPQQYGYYQEPLPPPANYLGANGGPVANAQQPLPQEQQGPVDLVTNLGQDWWAETLRMQGANPKRLQVNGSGK